MIRINQHHLDKFKFFNDSYNYQVVPGLWLTFDKTSLEYRYNTMFYTIYSRPKYLELEQLCDAKINKLIALDILEIVD